MKHFAIALMVAMTTTPVAALETAVGLTAGLYGAGATVTLGVNENIGVRFQFSEFSADESVDADDIDYDADITLGGFGTMFDYYPLAGKFRISSGLFSNASEITALAAPEAGTTIGGGSSERTTQAGDTLSMDMSFGGVAPYFGFGWGNAADPDGWPIGFGVDLGVVAMSPDVTLTATGSISNAQDALDAEARQAEDDLKEFKLYPVIQSSLSYRF